MTRDGQPFVTVQRGDSSVAHDAQGTEIQRFTSDPQDAETPDLFWVDLAAPGGRSIGEPAVRDVLLAACVDIAIGLRPYIAEMS